MNELSITKTKYLDLINRIVLNHKVSHTYLIELDNYDSDLKYVYDFIKMILLDISHEALLKSDDPIISLIDTHNYPDIMEIKPVGNLIKKGQLLDLQQEFNNTSLIGDKRFYIIMDADKMNSASSNTILKFLEEPGDNIYAFLLVHNRYQVLDTILSRCQILTLCENSLDFEIDENLIKLLGCVLHPKDLFIQYNTFINELFVDKNIFKDELLNIEKIFILYLNDKYTSTHMLNEEILDLFKDIDSKVLLKYLSIIEEEIGKIDFNVNYKLWVDSLFSKLIIGGELND